MVRLLVPVPVPDLGYFNRAVPGTRVFSRGSIELTKVSGTDMNVEPNLPKCRVRVRKSYQAYQSVGQSVGYGYGCRSELTKVLGMRMGVVPSLTTCRVRVYKGCVPRVHFGTFLT